MKSARLAIRLLVCLFLVSIAAFAQTSNGTITGTVTDATGAVVVNARVEAKNVDTGVVYPAVSTDTGNYTVTQLPVGRYEVGVNVQGFKKYERQGLTLAAAQIMRIDIPLQVGSNTEAVTVTAEATLLKTESSELVHNVTGTMLQELPILGLGGGGVGANTSGFRDPFALTKLIPGIQYNVNASIIANGSADKSIRVEGQVAGNIGGLAQYTAQTQPSVDAIQEVAVQTSNYAAEFGTAGGAIINVTMKSGANQYHGSLYDYAVNEVLNASPSMHQADRSAQRRHDYGGTLGGPVSIPKLYNGQNKTFFFWSFEQFRENLNVRSSLVTVPTPEYRVGNFADVIYGSGQDVNGVHLNRTYQVGGKDYVDPLGRTGIFSGTIFDPFTTTATTCNKTLFPTANCGSGNAIQVRNPFPNNQIPQTAQYLDPVFVKVQKLIPLPTGPNSLKAHQIGDNFQNPWISHRTSEIPSIKIDETVGSKGHVSFYWSTTGTESQYSFPNGNMEGFPAPITVARGTFIHARTVRLNYDHTVTPTLLLHLGAGYSNNNFLDDAPSARSGGYDAVTELGLRGATLNRTFPVLVTGASSTLGGMSNMGPGAQGPSYEQRPSANANATWVKGNHTYKLGGEWRQGGYPAYGFSNTAGTYTFGGGPTGQISTVDLGGATASQGSINGFQYASFMMGQATGGTLSVPTALKTGNAQWGLFLQDTWKLTRKLTFDYGMRWDYGTYSKEQYGRNGVLDLNIPNPNAGGHPGAQKFEANCGCSFMSNYPYQIGPRVGIAYQIDRKTVFRGGAGVVYQQVGLVSGSASNTASAGTPAFDEKLFQFSGGMPTNVQPKWPNLVPESGFTAGTVALAPTFLDRNSMRSPRVYQFSVGLQREIHRNLVVEASYVGNRAIWVSAAGLAPINVASVQLLQKYNFSVTDVNDQILLRQQIQLLTTTQKATLAAKGVTVPPYNGFPTSGQTVRQMILPFPQYTGINSGNAPLGQTWYDSLQVVATQRLSHGLSMNANYTFSKAQTLNSSTDPFNAIHGKDYSANDLPHQFRFSAEYTVPRIRSGNKFLGNKVLGYVLADWGLGWYMQYQSAGVIGRPGSVTGAANATANVSTNGVPTVVSFCPFATGCDNPISNWLGYGPGSAELKRDANGNQVSPYVTTWTDRGGVVHTNEPLDINCRCYEPTKTQVFDPNAWVSVPSGVFAPDQSTYRWFRGIRSPSENANISRTFRVKERMSFQIRVEFTNVFNRLNFNTPGTGNFTSNPTSANGLFTGGWGTFGNIQTTGTGAPRTGLFIARLQF